MFKDGDRVQLKCVYCAKIFRGGGIHRIKEHLACQKGNASTCHRVPPDVRQAMQESLDGVVVKKRKKQKLADEISTPTSINPVSNDDVDTFGNECGVNTEVHLIVHPDTLEPNSSFMTPREEGMSVKLPEKRKRGRPPKNSFTAHPANGDSVPVTEGHIVPSNEIDATPLKKVSSPVHLAIGRFLYDIGVPLDAVNSVYFQPMVDAIASEGPGILAPSHHDLRGWVLKSAVDEVKADMDYCTRAWVRTGCSLLVEECNTGKGMTFLNFLVYCPEGTMFLKSVNVTNTIGEVESMYELLKQVVEDVGVRNLLQVITPIEEYYAAAGKRLSETYPTLYWAPCASSSIILMLQAFGNFEWINSTLEQCKSITRFIYNHSVVLNMMRRYTFGMDLVVPDISPFVTNFRTVKRMVDFKHNLQALVTSQEWVDSHYSKKEGGLTVLDLISDDSFWSSCNEVVQITNPLLRVLNIVSSEKKPAMGYVYAGMYRAKESLKKELRKKNDYLTYWNVIDQRWGHHQLALYAAGFYLNPKFFYSIEGDMPGAVVSGMFDCIERLVPDTKIQDKIIKELNSYKTAAGDLGRKMAIRARESLLPSEWWSTYGGACPNLSRLAVRVVSQCCSLMQCKRDLIPLEQMHHTSNSLEHQRLNDQVFTQYNLRLRQMAQRSKEHDNMDPISVENHASVHDWIARKGLCLDDHASFDWLSIEPPSSNKMLLRSSTDEVEELAGGFDDYEIFGGAKDDEDTLED